MEKVNYVGKQRKTSPEIAEGKDPEPVPAHLEYAVEQSYYSTNRILADLEKFHSRVKYGSGCAMKDEEAKGEHHSGMLEQVRVTLENLHLIEDRLVELHNTIFGHR